MKKTGAAKGKVTPFADDLEYMQEELECADALLHAHALRLSEEGASEDDDGIRPRHPFEIRTRRPRRLAGDSATAFRTAARKRNALTARLEATRAAGIRLGADRLCEAHGLDDFERMVLIVSAAPTFSRTFEKRFDAINNGGFSSEEFTVDLAFTIADFSMVERFERRASFGPKSPLVKGGLITLAGGSRLWSPSEMLTATIEPTITALAELLGRPTMDDEFLSFSALEEPLVTFDQVVLPEVERDRILALVDRHETYLQARADWGLDKVIPYGRSALMLFYGPPGTGKTLTAHAVAHRLGKRVLNVDIPTFIEGQEADRFLPGLFRQARMRNAILFFDECETLFASRRHGNALMTLLLTELERFEGLAILATNLPDALDEALARRILVRVRFPRPDVEAREAIWRTLLPPTVPLADDVDLRSLATRFELTGGYIKNAVLGAVARASWANGLEGRITQADLESSATAQLTQPSTEDAGLVKPRARLSDVILPERTTRRLREILDAARRWSTVLERWRIGEHVTRGRGLVALFHGPSGTGKTLSVEALAGELGRPLLEASLPALKSKWVGETEKNLAALFARARAERAVLLIDEVDAILQTRGEAGSNRHDDAVVNVLLGLLEHHEELVVLATNLPKILDPALSRRVMWRVTFDEPTPEARAAIWRGLIPDTVPRDGEIRFDLLGERYPLSGGLIKNAVFKAAFRAASAGRGLTQADLEGAADEQTGALNPAPRTAGFR